MFYHFSFFKFMFHYVRLLIKSILLYIRFHILLRIFKDDHEINDLKTIYIQNIIFYQKYRNQRQFHSFQLQLYALYFIYFQNIK